MVAYHKQFRATPPAQKTLRGECSGLAAAFGRCSNDVARLLDSIKPPRL